MLTPAMSASSTSEPLVIMPNAFSTQVTGPPFLNRCPLPEATTIGLTDFGVIIVGAWANAERAAADASPAAVPVLTNSRRLILLAIVSLLPGPATPDLVSADCSIGTRRGGAPV